MFSTAKFKHLWWLQSSVSEPLILSRNKFFIPIKFKVAHSSPGKAFIPPLEPVIGAKKSNSRLSMIYILA